MIQNNNYDRIKKALEFIAANFESQPGMEEIASHIHLSEFHFQRLFKEWVGISPKKFLQFITLKSLKEKILDFKNLQELSESSGLSSQSRVYDLFVNIEATTPNEYKTKGRGMEIRYGIHETPFGKCLIANTDRGICALEFIDNNELEQIHALKKKWNNATLIHDQGSTSNNVLEIFRSEHQNKIKLLLSGTPFQLKVWEALIKIPYGSCSSYSTIAEAIGHPNSSRAVANAIGQNNIAYLIPCHRVIRKLGGFGGYKWGEARKLSMLGYEQAKSQSVNS